MQRSTSTLLIACLLAATLAPLAQGSGDPAQPPTPSDYQGTVKVGTADLPDNTIVFATMHDGSNAYTSATSTVQLGKYDHLIVAPPSASYNGGTVTFYAQPPGGSVEPVGTTTFAERQIDVVVNLVYPSTEPPSKVAGLSWFGNSGEVVLSWNAPFDSGSAITKYTVVRDGSTIATTTTQLTYTDTGRTNGATYVYKVFASNANGDGPESDSVSAIAGARPAKMSVSAVAGDKQVALTWSAPSAGTSAITGYTVYRDGSVIATLAASAVGYTNVGLANGVSYSFQVTATNQHGEGPKSDALARTPTAPSTGGGGGGGSGGTGSTGGDSGSGTDEGTDSGTDDGTDSGTDDGTDTGGETSETPGEKVKKANEQIASTLKVQLIDGSNHVTWSTNEAEKFQVWRQNSPFTLIATITDGSQTFIDLVPPPGAKYLVTAFVTDDSGADVGKYNDINGVTIPGNPDQQATAAERAPSDSNLGWIIAIIVVVSLVGVGGAVAFVLILRRTPPQ